MKPLVTTQIFQSSFYYPGPGFDIQPLQRFTHVCENFLYANLFINEQEVSAWYDKKLNSGDFELISKEVFNDFREEVYFEKDNNYLTHLRTWPQLYMQQYEIEGYFNSFRPALEQPQFLIHYKVKRVSLNRVFNLYFLTGEGIASYIVLSQNGKYAPKVLATIQTGQMEKPTGIMNKFYENSINERPLFWLRGFEPDHYFDGHRGPDNDALDETGVFNKRIMNFKQWQCGIYSSYSHFNRHVRAFVTENEFSRTYHLKNLYQNINHVFKLKTIEQNDLTGKLLVCNNHLIQRFRSLGWDFRSVSWEQLYNYRTLTVKDQINQLISHLHTNKINETLVIVPDCFEDEGLNYFNAIKELKNRTETLLLSHYDFYDLFLLTELK